MAALNPPVCDFGSPALNFELLGTDGQKWTLEQCAGSKGLLIMFICNHCPYVKAIHQRILRDTAELKTLGIATVAISSNDIIEYPEDSFENMQKLAKQLNFDFPYLLDESQDIAKQYGAVCTPDFFGYNNKLELQYRGRLDASKKESADDVKRDLFEAMKQVAQTGHGPKEQIASMGCSIKWKKHV
ncbi:MAG: thioredoxin family protein [Methylococcales symbiont of Iophon sp. n. MRB-2018]|nr:MAG: thioredoxin family protein [Methylococcales symbiont of Iophon sp. n. MRB-2018]KAF3980087.1 MAG: thioredoxin family protein [Methylococcales symbiont of Iophon sp. n. MRB-2018]